MVTIFDVYVITDRPTEKETKWTPVGVGFLNKDDSINIILDCIPLTGKIHLRKREKAIKKVEKL